MSAIQTWACFLLWISFATQDKTPDVHVTCMVSEECVLPCSFLPGSEETIKWFRQDVMVYKFERKDGDGKDGDGKDGDGEDGDGEDGDGGDSDGDSDGDSSEEEHFQHEQFDGRASVFPQSISRGNATLILRRSGLKDRGTYKCHVHTSQGEHDAKVIVKVEAPIRGLSLELSRLSGYEEMECTVRDVFPAPRVTWATEPATFEDLRPVTRITADKQRLYTVHSRLKRLTGLPELIYICKVTTSYGGPAWTSSLRQRELRGAQGKDLTIPCSAPSYLNKPFLHWSFSNSKASSNILTYDSRTGYSNYAQPWDKHVELDGFRVPFGDGSLRLMDPKPSEHTGSYTCVFSVTHKTHTERSIVHIDDPVGGRSTAEEPSYWWIAGLVIAVLGVALVAMLTYLKMRGGSSKPRNDPEEATELHLVKDSPADSNLNESSPLTVGDTNGQPGLQTALS